MTDHKATGGEDSLFSIEDLVSASEFREFVFWERAWFLARQGHAISAKAQRTAGVAFHVQRAGAACKADSNRSLWWAIILIFAAFAVWLLKSLLGAG